MDERTPVVVGVGFEQQPGDDPDACPEALELMIRAARDALRDAGGGGGWARQLDAVCVAQGIWSYRNPGHAIAAALGCPGACSVLAGVGVLQLALLAEPCRAIAAGEWRAALVIGGEAKYRELRSLITGRAVPLTEQGDDVPPPDRHLTSSDGFCSDLEAQRGLRSPVEFYAIIESALRHRRGWSVEEHRDRVARLYAGFSAIAASNPHAWRREALAPERIRDAAPDNPMLAFPYTKRHASQWNVNRAVALLVCSAATAEALAVDRARWIFPLAIAESRHVVPLAQMARLHGRPGTRLTGERAFAMAGVGPGDVTRADLYSCFPSAVQSSAFDLGLDERIPWSVTGAMPFSGGPFNHASLDGAARMVELLRADAAAGGARPVGLVSNLSGIFGKQGCALLSSEPGSNGFGYADVTDAVTDCDAPVPLDADYAGPAAVAGYTVVYRDGAPSHAFAICDTPAGARTVARSADPPLLDALVREELCGRKVDVARDGSFRVPATPAIASPPDPQGEST